MTTYTARGLPVTVWPNRLKSVDQTLHLRANTQTFTSPFTRTTQTVDISGPLFEVQASYPPMSDAEIKLYRAFVAKLRGQAGRFIFPAYCCRYQPPAPLQAERVTMIFLTADSTKQTADQTNITADRRMTQMESIFAVTSSPDETTIVGTLYVNSGKYPLEVGSYISWDDPTGWRHLHMIVDMTTTGAQTTLTVEPPMKYQPLATTTMHTHAPSGIFMLTDDGQGAIRMTGGKGSFSIGAMQTFPLEITV